MTDTNNLAIALLAALLLLLLAVAALISMARNVGSLQRQLDLADQQIAAKDKRIELLVAERAQLKGHREIMQHAINHYITSLPKANKTHARRLAAERNMN